MKTVTKYYYRRGTGQRAFIRQINAVWRGEFFPDSGKKKNVLTVTWELEDLDNPETFRLQTDMDQRDFNDRFDLDRSIAVKKPEVRRPKNNTKHALSAWK